MSAGGHRVIEGKHGRLVWRFQALLSFLFCDWLGAGCPFVLLFIPRFVLVL
jgi:hypothetical protein